MRIDNLGAADVALAIGRAGIEDTKDGWASPKRGGSLAEGRGREGHRDFVFVYIKVVYNPNFKL